MFAKNTLQTDICQNFSHGTVRYYYAFFKLINYFITCKPIKSYYSFPRNLQQAFKNLLSRWYNYFNETHTYVFQIIHRSNETFNWRHLLLKEQGSNILCYISSPTFALTVIMGNNGVYFISWLIKLHYQSVRVSLIVL